MRCSVLRRIGELELVDVADPSPSPGEVVIRVEACGVCGTDRGLLRGDFPIEVPIILGHEYAGEVVEVGKDVTSLRIGDRVAVDPNVVCGKCAACRRGQINLCLNLSPLGIVRSGGYAQFSAVPEQNAYLIPASMTAEEAALLEPLACSIRGNQLADIQLGDTVVVLGGGPMGCLLVQLARLRGAARVVVSEPNPVRRALAVRLGADVGIQPGAELEALVRDATLGRGADVVFEAAGSVEAAGSALTLLRRGGTAMWFGSCPERGRLTVSPYQINDAEVTIRGSFINPYTHSMALELVASGRVDVRSLVTDHAPLQGLVDALNLSSHPEAMKMVILPNSPN